MLISLRADGTAVMLLPSHVYQGSNVANVFVTAPFPNTTVLQVGFTLPNGTKVSAPMTYVQDPENNLVVWQYTIAAAITNEAGAASVSVTATTQTGQVIASQSIPFTIEATTLPVLPDVPSQDEYTLILQYLQQNSAKIATLQGQISAIEADVATANDNASAAVTTANEAKATADEAKATADSFAAEIATANQNASEALDTANQVAADVGQYTAQIAQANANASAAVQTANAAQATANEAKSASDANQQAIEAIINNDTLISTDFGGFKAGKEITAEEDGIAIGNDIQAIHTNCISIGQGIINDEKNSIIIGDTCRNQGENSIEIGNNHSNSRGDYNILVGDSCDPIGSYGVMVGVGCRTDENGVAIGNNAEAAGDSVQLGTGTNNTRNTLQFQSKTVIDGSGNLYENNIKLSEIYAKRTFFENLYFTRTGALTATLQNVKPTANANNYLTTTTTNTSLDFSSTTKLTITRTLAATLQLDNNDSVRIALSFATNRNASIEFGARILIGGVAISSNQAFGLNTVNGDTGFANVNDVSINITCDLITGSQEFAAGQIITIEIFTRQINSQSLITRYFCGVAIGGADRNCFAGINATATSINTNQLADGAVTIPKLGLDVKNLINSKEPAFSKNTAFNKNFGTTAGTVCEGNDERLSNARPASDVYAWAKQPTKPTYTKAEVGLGNVDNVRQYSVQNPPPYPVTSVDGKTGAVTLYNLYAPKNAILWMGRLTVGNTITISYQSYSKIKVFYAYYEWEDSTEVDVANAPYGSINVQMSVSQQSTFEIKSWNGVAVLSGNQLNFNHIIVLSNGTSATSDTSNTAFKILRVEGIN